MDILRFEHLTVSLGDGRQLTVSGAVPEGGVLAVRGPSGSGKSTLLKALARLRPHESGQLWLRGTPASQIPPTSWRRQVHYFSQRPVLFDGSILDNIRLPGRLAVRRGEPPVSEAAVREAMRRVLLDHDPSRDARTLSGGEAARVALLRAVLARPAVLLLDEPTASLDSKARQAVLAFLQRWLQEEPGRALVLVSHLDDDLTSFPQAAVLDLDRHALAGAPGGEGRG